MQLQEPYVKTLVTSTVDTTYRKSLRKLGYTTKRRNTITFPALNIVNVWRGASEIIAKINYDLSSAVSLIEHFPITPAPSGVNYCACIAWKPDSNTIVRYKLWQNVGEILYVPLYSGQKIGANFFIEIWNTNNNPIVGPALTFYTSLLTVPSNRCDSSDINNSFPYRNCTDLLFNLDGYDPINNDYYLIVADCGETDLIHASKLIIDSVTLQSTDSSWHVYNLLEFTDGDGNTIVSHNVDQNNSSAALTPLIPLIFGDSVYSFALKAQNDPEFGLNHYPYVTGLIGNVLDYVGAYGSVVIKTQLGNQHQVRLFNFSGDITPFIDPNIYVP